MKFKTNYLIPLLILVLDQITKYLFQYKDLTLIPYILLIKYSENPGIIFGWFSYSIIFTFILPLLISAVFIYYSFRSKDRLFYLLISVGLLGNLLTRLFYGYVIDFIFIPIYPALNISNFNIADASLIVGILGLIYQEIKK